MKTILIVEDDKKTTSLVALYLEKEGFNAMVAHDGIEGLAIAKQHHPILVILDLMLRLGSVPTAPENFRCSHHYAHCSRRGS